MNQDISEYVNSPGLLLQLCQNVVEQIDALQNKQKFNEIETQLKEVSRAITKLEKSNIQVPNELRKLKIGLASELSVRDETSEVLLEMLDGFEDIVKQLYTLTGRKNEGSRSPVRRSKAPRTGRYVLREEIIKALHALGGSSHAQQVLQQMNKQLEGRLLPGDLEQRKSGEIAWENNSCWERYRMVLDGILKNDSPRGIWELEGIEMDTKK